MRAIYYFFSWALRAAVEQDAVKSAGDAGAESALKGLYFLFAGAIVIVVLPIAIIVIKKVLKDSANARMKSYTHDLETAVKKYEAQGAFVSAAHASEKLGNMDKAASLYEKGRDFRRAALIYESLNRYDKAMEAYEKAGDLRKAAEAAGATGDFAGSARLYKQAGLTLDAARALESGGNNLAAVREYREAGEYARAAELLLGAGMKEDAAQMFKLSLAQEAEVTSGNIHKFYAYAGYLRDAGMKEAEANVLKNIAAVDPYYKNVRARLSALGVAEAMPEKAEPYSETAEPLAPPPEEPLLTEEELLQASSVSEGETVPPAVKEVTLRSMMRGKMEPRFALRLWVQALKALSAFHRQGLFWTGLSPDAIYIDSANNVRIEDAGPFGRAYFAPERLSSGGTPKAAGDVYAMGMILLEMITGGIEAGSKPSEAVADVPGWLDELVLRCVSKNEAGRFGSLEEIFSYLKEIRARKE